MATTSSKKSGTKTAASAQANKPAISKQAAPARAARTNAKTGWWQRVFGGRVARFGRALMPLGRNFGLFATIAVAVIASQLAMWWKPIVGVYTNAGLFAVLLGLGLWKDAYRKLAISVAIFPVAAMLDLALPQGNAFAQAVVFYDTILLLALVYRFWFTLDEPVRNTSLKLRGYALALPMMAVIGQLLGVLGYGLLRKHFVYTNISLPLVAATACVFALAEEMFFRGLIQQRAAKIMHPGMAAALSVVVYTCANIGYGTILAPLFALVAGIVLSATYYMKQNLLLTFTINAMSKLAYIGLLATFVLR